VAGTTTTVHDFDLGHSGLGHLHHLQRLHDEADWYVRFFDAHWAQLADYVKGNFLFIAIYVFSKEALAEKVEQTIAVSISWYVQPFIARLVKLC
jgi:hypothetical protein